ncbi:KH domain-containing protein [Candidatus Daviesbacteria bacterium]|nr:KH domain-containing protein [Candidatus Daviesbacteria bacterium]
MKDLVEYIVKQIVNNPDAVVVEQSQNNGDVNLLLTVAPEDMGIVIGKGGQTIKAVRKLLVIRAMAENARVNLQIAEPEKDGEPTEQSSPAEPAQPQNEQALLGKDTQNEN